MSPVDVLRSRPWAAVAVALVFTQGLNSVPGSTGIALVQELVSGPHVSVESLMYVAPASVQRPARSAALVFDGVTVVDVEAGRLVPDQRVVITGNRIRAVGNRRTVAMPRGARVVQAQGKYAVPGLWDMHVHPGRYPHIFYPLLIANGVTGIREPGNNPVPLDSVLRWRQEVAAGVRVGPRFVTSGPTLIASDEGRMLCRPSCPRELRLVTTSAEVRHVVDSLKTAGADFIKTHSEAPPREIYFAIASEARRIGIPFSGHVPDSVTAIEASDSGHRIVDHIDKYPLDHRCYGTGASVEKCAPVAARFSRNGTWFAPTLVVASYFQSVPRYAQEHLRYWPDSVRRTSKFKEFGIPSSDSLFHGYGLQIIRQAGLPVLAGTDAAPLFPEVAPGFSLHEELELLVIGGLTPLDALRAATINPAKALAATDSLGTIAVNKLADFILLNADPLADIRNSRTIHAVVANGRFFDRPTLDVMLADVERAAR